MARIALIPFFCVIACLAGDCCRTFAQAPETPVPAAPSKDLSAAELQVFRDYERFEKALFDVGEQLRRKDPERAGLLYRARSQSQEQNILAELQTIAELLRSQNASGAEVNPQYGPAADRQKEVLARMKSVLKLLQSQDERERVAAEINRIQDLLKETNKVIAKQKDVRADTQRAKEASKTKEAQQRVEEDAKKLSEKIAKQDADREERRSGSPESDSPEDSSDPKSGKDQSGKPESDKKNSESQGEDSSEESEDKPGEKETDSEGKRNEGKSDKQKEGKKPSGEKKSDGSPQEGQNQGEQGDQKQSDQQGQKGEQGQKSQDSQPKQNPSGSQKTAGREQLEQARQKMQQAIEELQKNQKEEAVEQQDQAVNKLEELKAQLEEILRQLREDERESYLTMLEARFQNMLLRQQHVNNETARLDRIPATERPQQNFASQTENNRKEQEDNALEAEKSLHLLKEEGSSVAFPEAVDQMHQNMILVAGRLSRQETGQTTQLMEKMISDTLEEMIAALRQELQKKQEGQQGQQGGSQGQPQEPGLVNQLAELKLIRSLQSQINLLTKQIGTEVVSGSESTPDQLRLIQDLRLRQERIQEATYDLSVGRNQ